MRNVNSGLVFDAKGGSKKSGTNVWLYRAIGTGAQLWDVLNNGDGTYTLRSVLSGCALDVSGASTRSSANVQAYASNGTKAQRWRLSPVKQVVANGTYTIATSLNGGLALDVSAASRANKATVQLYGANGTNAQRWCLTFDAKTGYYTAVAVCSGKALDVPGGSATNGRRLWQYTPNGARAEVDDQGEFGRQLHLPVRAQRRRARRAGRSHSGQGARADVRLERHARPEVASEAGGVSAV